jgi:hypothetical protein
VGCGLRDFWFCGFIYVLSVMICASYFFAFGMSCESLGRNARLSGICLVVNVLLSMFYFSGTTDHQSKLANAAAACAITARVIIPHILFVQTYVARGLQINMHNATFPAVRSSVPTRYITDLSIRNYNPLRGFNDGFPRLNQFELSHHRVLMDNAYSMHIIIY